MIRIGCSGWNYRHWRGRFYPEKLPMKRWFAHYADHFDTVEINNSFYRLPPPATVEAWRDQAPPGFCYAVKANRYLTQARKLKDCEEPMERMMASFRHFGPTLGPILYQLPPQFGINLERLESFLRILPVGIAHIFEFRHPSWYANAVYALLDRHDAGLCIHDMPGSASPRLAIGGTTYVRFHGGGGKYQGRYAEARLREWSDWMMAQEKDGRAVWAYFNNDIDAAAVEDALTLKAMAGQKEKRAP